jgi:hypothetical protein
VRGPASRRPFGRAWRVWAAASANRSIFGETSVTQPRAEPSCPPCPYTREARTRAALRRADCGNHGFASGTCPCPWPAHGSQVRSGHRLHQVPPHPPRASVVAGSGAGRWPQKLAARARKLGILGFVCTRKVASRLGFEPRTRGRTGAILLVVRCPSCQAARREPVRQGQLETRSAGCLLAPDGTMAQPCLTPAWPRTMVPGQRWVQPPPYRQGVASCRCT